MIAHAPRSRNKLYAMLHAYTDASGSHDGSPQCIVAGYWGGKNEWGRFEREWNAVLKSENIAEFHAKNFWHRPRVREFKDWDDARHAQFIDRLLSIVENHKVFPFGLGVDIAEWNRQPAYYRKIYSGFHQDVDVRDEKLKAIFLSFQMAVGTIAHYCHDGVMMHFFFDKDPQVMGRIASCYTELSKPDQKHSPKEARLVRAMGELHFADSVDSAPIQAADLLAYELYRYNKKRGEPRMEMYRAMRRFKKLNDFWLFDAERFERLRESVELTAREMAAGV
jgi:hypothetical protein